MKQTPADKEEEVRISPRETVILADDFDAMVAWYVEVLGFKVVKRFDDGYRYANLETESGIRVGLAPAAEVGVVPRDRANSSVLLQIQVADAQRFFERLEEGGSTTMFGPSFDKTGQFWYGGFVDLEGNPIWVVDEHCP